MDDDEVVRHLKLGIWMLFELCRELGKRLDEIEKRLEEIESTNRSSE